MTQTTQITNSVLIRGGYQAFNAADVDTLSRLFADDATWTTPGRSGVAGTARGKEAVMAQFGRYGSETHGTFKANLIAIFEADDGRVVGLHHNVGERNGKVLATDCCVVFELEDGKVTAGTEYFFDLHDWDEFWS